MKTVSPKDSKCSSNKPKEFNCPDCNSPLKKEKYELLNSDTGIFFECANCDFIIYENTEEEAYTMLNTIKNKKQFEISNAFISKLKLKPNPSGISVMGEDGEIYDIINILDSYMTWLENYEPKVA